MREKAIWEDQSSYSQGDKERIPAVWVLRTPDMKVIVHRHVHYEKTDWLLSIDGACDKKLLLSTLIDNAKAEAVRYAREWLQRQLQALPE